MSTQSIKMNITELPFKTNLSFRPLIRRLQKEVRDNESSSIKAEEILSRLKKAPELRKSVVLLNDLKKHQDLVHFMLSAVFPPTSYDSMLSIATVPFDFNHFFCTPKYHEVIEDESKILTKAGETPDQRWNLYSNIMHAYVLILKNFYDFDLWVDDLFMYRLVDKYNGLENYYKMEIGANYAEINLLDKLKPLSSEEIYHLLNNPFNLDLWLETLPLDNFEFSGFLQLDFIDVTQLEVVSALKTELLKKSAIIHQDNFNVLELKMRSLLGLPNVKLGITALHFNNGSIRNPCELWKGFLCPKEYTCKDYEESFYEQALRESRTVLMNDLSQIKKPSRLEQGLMDSGIRNLSVTPLFYDKELVGILELGSTKAFDINFTQLKKIKDIIPVFSNAVKRSAEELMNRIQAAIKEECTALHPSVEWRFEEAAAKMLRERDRGENAKMEEIVFPDVVPLYGAIDIRHSSTERNKAIQQDLIEQLKLARAILSQAYRLHEMPIYDQLIYKIDKFIRSIKKRLSSGDESSVLNFLQSEIELLFDHFEHVDSKLKKAIESYYLHVDSELKIVYKRRKTFEESLIMINECITSFLEKEQEKAQSMFPHYFEKYHTDGVDHNIYIGQSLVRGKEFNSIYLKNLRLWQLLVSCESVRQTEKLKSKLPIPLSTTALILVHSQPLSIRFRQDEKKFDVDGAYNIRYEIVKKRIDKALIKNTGERLTQPGMLSIIFSQDSDLEEYQRYIEYLIAKGYFEDSVEQLPLEDLQGVFDLKALRVKIKMHKSGVKEVLKVAQEFKLERNSSFN